MAFQVTGSFVHKRGDFPVAEMGVARRDAHLGMAEQARDDGHGHAAHHRVAGMRVAQVVKPDILDTGFPRTWRHSRSSEQCGRGGWRGEGNTNGLSPRG